MHRSSLLVLAAVLMVPAAAIAGEKVTSGDQSLQITAKVSPAKASKKGKPRGVVLKLGVAYESLNENAQVNEHTAGIVVTLPQGMKVNTGSRKQCLLSAMLADNAGSGACPKGSQVGQGSATADVRPALPDPVPATVKIFNGLDDVAPDGTARETPIPAVILQADTTLGFNTTLPFDVVGSKLVLEYAPGPDGEAQPFHIATVDLTFPNAGKKAYITAPPKCSSPWMFGMEITNFDGPSIAASHAVPCKKA